MMIEGPIEIDEKFAQASKQVHGERVAARMQNFVDTYENLVEVGLAEEEEERRQGEKRKGKGRRRKNEAPPRLKRRYEELIEKLEARAGRKKKRMGRASK